MCARARACVCVRVCVCARARACVRVHARAREALIRCFRKMFVRWLQTDSAACALARTSGACVRARMAGACVRACQALAIFTELDTDNSGTIDHAEFEAALQRLDLPEATCNFVRSRCFGDLDFNSDGTVNFAEFLACFHTVPTGGAAGASVPADLMSALLRTSLLCANRRVFHPDQPQGTGSQPRRLPLLNGSMAPRDASNGPAVRHEPAASEHDPPLPWGITQTLDGKADLWA
jgi:hypothetical protein